MVRMNSPNHSFLYRKNYPVKEKIYLVFLEMCDTVYIQKS